MTIETADTMVTTRFQGGAAGHTAVAADAQTLANSATAMPISRTVTASATAAIGDRGAVVVMNTASANNFLIPTDATTNFDIGTILTVFVQGAGVTTVAAVTPGTTTVSSKSGTFTSSGQGSFLSAWKLSANTWWCFGDFT
jgi:hypothetical protein